MWFDQMKTSILQSKLFRSYAKMRLFRVRRVVSLILENSPEWQIVGEAVDGVEAVQKAEAQ